MSDFEAIRIVRKRARDELIADLEIITKRQNIEEVRLRTLEMALDLHERLKQAYISTCHNNVIDDAGREMLRINLFNNVYNTHMSDALTRTEQQPYNLRGHRRNSNA
jgi:hypothetical protein